MNPTENYDTMLKSFAAFEYIKSEDQDIIERILVILANLFIYESNSRAFMVSRFKEFKMVLKKLRYFINENDLDNEVRLKDLFQRFVWLFEQCFLF